MGDSVPFYLDPNDKPAKVKKAPAAEEIVLPDADETEEPSDEAAADE
jgi:hypothetical protein